MAQLESDVLVIGGGMAAAWAAIGAARAGASVILVDKGYVGTSGVTATGGPGHWFYMCELYCPADALFVASDCHQPESVNEQEVVASGLLGQFRRARNLE